MQSTTQVRPLSLPVKPTGSTIYPRVLDQNDEVEKREKGAILRVPTVGLFLFYIYYTHKVCIHQTMDFGFSVVPMTAAVPYNILSLHSHFLFQKRK